jgi:hypothetical protein
LRLWRATLPEVLPIIVAALLFAVLVLIADQFGGTMDYALVAVVLFPA